MFCAKAGAKQAIAVDNSRIINKARENIFRNGLGNKIICVKGKIEDVTLPVDKVDIIVSEWMGYGLLYEAMLPSIIYARDKYLKPGGLLVPSHASIWIAPVSDTKYISNHITFWRDVYGFDMLAMQDEIYADVRIQAMPESSLCGSASPFRILNLHEVKADDLVFDAKWQTKLSSNIHALDAFLVWFDIFFALSPDATVTATASAKDWSSNGHGSVSFTTGPHGPETHWKQCLLVIRDQPPSPALTAGEEILGEISYSIPDSNFRGLHLRISWGSKSKAMQSQTWRLH
jgi:protein arginine N-methyltransferase 3